MFGTYRAAFRAPGSVAFSAAAFIARLPIALYPIGLVLLVSIRTGHYGFAGLLSGMYVFSNGVGNPVLARLVDRHGQRRILPWSAGGHGLAIAAVCVLAEVNAPDSTLVAPTVLAGFCYLPMGSLARARWSYVLAGRPELTTAYSLESTLDEVIFMVGPLLVTVIATQLDPVLGLGLGAVLVVSGSAWLRTLRASEPPAHQAGTPPRPSALRSRGMGLMTVASFGMGGVFASVELTMVAFCGQHGRTELSGLVLACFALGSGVSGLIYGARPRSRSILARFRLQALVFAVMPLAFLGVVNIAVLAACAFVAGLAIAPALITGFGLIAELVPSASLTEGMAWLTTGLSVGYGLAASIVGGIADQYGARTAFVVPVGFGLLVGAVAALLYRRVSAPADASRPVPVG
ncbi:MAG: MFS transporter [Actinomycetota bacterium]